jgi:hypothetical protein
MPKAKPASKTTKPAAATAAPAAAPDKKAKKKAKAPPPVLPVVAAAEKYDPSADRRALAALSARYGAPAPDVSAALDALLDDPTRVALGAKTKGAGVFKDGVAWAVIADKALRESPAAVTAKYPVERFQYYLDRLAALDSAVSTQETTRGDKGTGKGTVAQRETALRKVREDLLFHLDRFAGRRQEENAALDTARGRSDNLDLLGKSIADLVTLGRSWLQRTDAAAQGLAKLAGVTPTLLDAAVASANDLTGAAADVTLAGRDRATDLPAVNLVEGTVLFEMAELMATFNLLNKRSPLVPRLIPGSATRHVLAPQAKAKAAEPAKPAAVQPATAAPAIAPAAG